MERDEIDELLNKLRYLLTEGDRLWTDDSPLEDIQRKVGYTAYMELEDDLSIIMDQYEEHGFNIGFRSCFQIMVGLMKG